MTIGAVRGDRFHRSRPRQARVGGPTRNLRTGKSSDHTHGLSEPVGPGRSEDGFSSGCISSSPPCVLALI